MNQELVEMAQKCGLIGMRPHLDGIYSEALEAFAQLVAAKAIAELESQEPVAWDLADKVRQDLDRQSCPDAFMRIAVESIVKHHSPQPAKPIPCANHCEATAFEIVIKNLQGEIERLKAPQRTAEQSSRTLAWVGLTDVELAEYADMEIGSYDRCLEVEAKLKEKNTN